MERIAEIKDLEQSVFTRLATIATAETKGPCGGVYDSVEVLHKTNITVKRLAPDIPVYCIHEIIHNNPVLEDFRREGVVFVEEPKDEKIKDGSVVVINAHGQPSWVVPYLERKGCHVIDMTCPFVKAIHVKVASDVAKNSHIVLFGDSKHVEAVGIASRAPEGQITIIKSLEQARTVDLPGGDLSFHTQTTAAGFEAERAENILTQGYPHIKTTFKGDRCTAVRIRQQGVKEFLGKVDVVIIVGSPTSKNTKNMARVAEDLGLPVLRVDEPEEIDLELLEEKQATSIGLSSGASVLDPQFTRVIDGIVNKCRFYGREPEIVEMPPTGEEKKHFIDQEERMQGLVDWLNMRLQTTNYEGRKI